MSERSIEDHIPEGLGLEAEVALIESAGYFNGLGLSAQLEEQQKPATAIMHFDNESYLRGLGLGGAEYND